ncbi:MAG: putative lipoprotein [Myxococcaceae bacterium]|nr:putative lipoprotein [Myxococcaceae bacterium]
MLRSSARILSVCSLLLAACDGSGTIGSLFNCTEVTRFRELELVDTHVLASPAAQNRTAGALSFRHAIEQLAAGSEPALFATHWLDAWNAEAGLASEVRCGWLRSRAANACDVHCAQCAERVLDLSEAPFRLIGVANRSDLGRLQDAVSSAGEGRLIYALTDGPADDPSSATSSLTLILEYGLFDDTDARGWATRWHALSNDDIASPAYVDALLQISERFVARDTATGRVAGSSLSRLRINDRRNASAARFSEFSLADDGSLAVLPLAVMSDPSIPMELATCEGCHATSNGSLDGFHVSPHGEGTAKLSTFLQQPNDWHAGELAKREVALQTLLCSE